MVLVSITSIALNRKRADSNFYVVFLVQFNFTPGITMNSGISTAILIHTNGYFHIIWQYYWSEGKSMWTDWSE